MKEIATALGFIYNRRGCSCNGSPYIYIARRNRVNYELTIYEKRNTWKLSANNNSIASGNAANLKTKITEIWD